MDTGLEMASTFTVSAKYDARPLRGASIYITFYDGSANFFFERTSADGTVDVKDLRPGKYVLDVQWLGIHAASEHFEVRAIEPKQTKSRLEYVWGQQPLTVQQVAGKVVDLRPRPGDDLAGALTNPMEVPMNGVRLRLLEAITGTTAYTELTDEHGDFGFKALQNGTYVLHVEGADTPNEGSSDVLIQVTPDAKRDSLKFGRTGMCGDYYFQLRQ
jgi:hypothetical protein